MFFKAIEKLQKSFSFKEKICFTGVLFLLYNLNLELFFFQSKMIPRMLEGKHVVCAAETGQYLMCCKSHYK